MRTSMIALAVLIAGGPAWADVCDYCGCRGGPGYRDADGRCVGHKALKKVCGSPPTTRCTYEGGGGSAADLVDTLVDAERTKVPDVSAEQAIARRHEEMRKIYREFVEFRSSDVFRQKGFANSSPFRSWPKRLDAIKADRDYSSHLLETCDVLPADLWMLSIDYMKERQGDDIAEQTRLWDECFPG